MIKPYFSLGKRVIDSEAPAFLIAEIGLNHNGNLELGLKMIEAAAEAGADAVKFQTFNTALFLNSDHPDFANRKRHELRSSEFEKLFNHAIGFGLEPLSTPFDNDSVDMLCDIGSKAIKIASADLNNVLLLKKVGSTSLPVIISTGYSTLSEILKAKETLLESGAKEIAILHCVASYPTAYEDINLANIPSLVKLFPDSIIGFSDHSLDYELIPPSAVALGARIVEKHFTIDRGLQGYDHEMSLDPKMFAAMVKQVRRIEEAYGKARLQTGVIKSEEVRLVNARRSLYWAKNANKGETINESHIIAKRPGNGLPPCYIEQLIGCTLQTDIKKDTLVNLIEAG